MPLPGMTADLLRRSWSMPIPAHALLCVASGHGQARRVVRQEAESRQTLDSLACLVAAFHLDTVVFDTFATGRRQGRLSPGGSVPKKAPASARKIRIKKSYSMPPFRSPIKCQRDDLMS